MNRKSINIDGYEIGEKNQTYIVAEIGINHGGDLDKAIKLIDEHFDLRRRISEQKIKLDELSSKFKELKILAIKYKDVKEIEIDDLNKEIDKIKKNIDEANIMYENMLDKTTESLEKIIQSAETPPNTQQ